MKLFGLVLQVRTVSGNPVMVDSLTITPRSQALILQVPFGALVWNRPFEVLVQREGETRRIPIVDITRLVQIGLLALGLVAAALTIARPTGKKARPTGKQ